MMVRDGYALYLIYLLLISYYLIYFFYPYKFIFCKKRLLLTTSILKRFSAKVLRCSNLYFQVTTMLLHVTTSKLANYYLNIYLSM